LWAFLPRDARKSHLPAAVAVRSGVSGCGAHGSRCRADRHGRQAGVCAGGGITRELECDDWCVLIYFLFLETFCLATDAVRFEYVKIHRQRNPEERVLVDKVGVLTS